MPLGAHSKTWDQHRPQHTRVKNWTLWLGDTPPPLP